MVDRAETLYPEFAIIFLSSWQRPEDVGGHNFIHGDGDVVERCFREMQPTMRLIERCNINPSLHSEEELQKVIAGLAEEGDPAIVQTFQNISELLLDGDPRADANPYCGQALVMVGWMELGTYFHRYIEFVGMARGIVSLFNAAIDSFHEVRNGEEQI